MIRLLFQELGQVDTFDKISVFGNKIAKTEAFKNICIY